MAGDQLPAEVSHYSAHGDPRLLRGQQITIVKDRAKNKSSHRTLPLVPAFEELLLRLLEEQQKNRLLYKASYSNDYNDYIYVDKLGQRIKTGYITQHFPIVLEKHDLRRIRFQRESVAG